MTLAQHRNYRDGAEAAARTVHDASLGSIGYRLAHLVRVAQSYARAAEHPRAALETPSFYARGYVDEAIMLACLYQLRVERLLAAAVRFVHPRVTLQPGEVQCGPGVMRSTVVYTNAARSKRDPRPR